MKFPSKDAKCETELPRCFSGLEKGVFWKGVPENPQTVENRGESDHFLEILENLETLETLEIVEIPPVKRPLS